VKISDEDAILIKNPSSQRTFRVTQ